MTKNKSITELLNPYATYDDKTKTLVIDVGALDPDGSITTGEGLVLRLIRLLAENQEGAADRAMDVSKTTPFLSHRAGVPVLATSVSLRFFGSEPIQDIQPEQL